MTFHPNYFPHYFIYFLGSYTYTLEDSLPKHCASTVYVYGLTMCLALYFYPYYTLFPMFVLEETQNNPFKPHLTQLLGSPALGIAESRQLSQPHS